MKKQMCSSFSTWVDNMGEAGTSSFPSSPEMGSCFCGLCQCLLPCPLTPMCSLTPHVRRVWLRLSHSPFWGRGALEATVRLWVKCPTSMILFSPLNKWGNQGTESNLLKVISISKFHLNPGSLAPSPLTAHATSGGKCSKTKGVP